MTNTIFSNLSGLDLVFFFPSCEIQTTGHTVSHTPPTSQRQLCMKTFVVKAKPTSGGHRHKDSCILDVTLVLSNKTYISFFLYFFNSLVSTAF